MRYEVDSERVSQASAAVNGSVGAIRAEVGAMMRNLQDLQSSWHGSAATSFAGVMGQWQSTQTQVGAALDAVTAALFLTTEAVVADKPEKNAAAPAGDGGMGGMDF